MSSSREPQRSVKPWSDGAGSMGSRQAPLSLIQSHRQLWREGKRLSVEAFLREYPPHVLSDEEQQDLIYNEVVLREEDGESPVQEEYLERFPQFDRELRAMFEIHRALESRHAFTLELSTSSFDLNVSRPDAHAGEVAIRQPPSSHDGPVSTDRRPGERIDLPGTPLESSWPVLRGYDIQTVLGSGGMGTVYRAYDRDRRRHVALKMMNRTSAATIVRFKREFRTLLNVAHPNLVTLYELIFDGKNWFLTMELLEGANFLQHVRGHSRLSQDVSGTAHFGRSGPDLTHPSGPLAPSAALPSPISTHDDILALTEKSERANEVESSRLPPPAPRSGDQARWARLREATRQLATGIAWLHAAGKLHRDIKPTNVIVTHEGRVVLLDFGLVADQGFDGRHQSTEEHILGTAAYMAPEQAVGLPVSSAADWYSVGVMLFQALTGRLPFVGSTVAVLLDKQTIDPPAPSALASDVPDDLSALCADLLRRSPEQRPSAPEVMRRLGDPRPDQTPFSKSDVEVVRDPSGTPGQGRFLVGRERHRQALDLALAEMISGRTVVLYLSGPSGGGKSALLKSFLDERDERADAVVLAGRCYERESVLYKALDSLIDALGRHLQKLPEAEVAAILPRDMVLLARVFPALAQVEAHAHSPRRAFDNPDPQELRRRAFAALRELLARLGDRHPLILAIDDLQWGDVDSAALIADLLRPPDAPVLLFLGTYRTEDRTTSAFLNAIFDLQASHSEGQLGVENEIESVRASKLNVRELMVDPLEPGETRALANSLLGEGVLAPGRVLLVDAIARESAGNPFFVAELVRHAQSIGLDTGKAGSSPAQSRFRTSADWSSDLAAIALDDVIWARIGRLPDEPRRVLELIAVSGQPLALGIIGSCVDLLQDERVSLALLTASRLVRSAGGLERNEVETYHDRIRETVVARLDQEAKRDHHRRLAVALEASGTPDPEVLGVHFLEGGQPERATDLFVRAADQAARALAFDRAASLYRRARDLQPASTPASTIHQLNSRMGDALANAGRGAEAAAAYLAAMSDAPADTAIELQRKAAMQFLISGHIDDGLKALRTVLAAIGMSLPVTPRRALLSLLAQRARLRFRGLGYRERQPDQIAQADLTRIDVCWSASAGLSVVDTIRGADFQARGLLLSLAAGEPSRIARSLAMEAAHAASTGGSNRKTTARLLDRATALASRVEDPYASGMVALARGVSAYLEGQWTLAQQECDRAETIFRDGCTGVAWELDTAHAFALWGLSHQGAIAELSRRWPILLDLARARGDLYAVMNLSSYIMSIVRLAADEPETAGRELGQTMSQWSRAGYHVQHNDALWAGAQIELYKGDGAAAWNLIAHSWPALRRSMLLRVQFIRTSMNFLRARAALAAAVMARRSQPTDVSPLLAVARRSARLMERERMPCPTAYARLVRGALAAVAGDSDRAVPLLTEAAACFDRVDMRLCAAATRRRIGELQGDAWGQSEIDRAARWMAAEKIKNPDRMAAMIITPLN